MNKLHTENCIAKGQMSSCSELVQKVTIGDVGAVSRDTSPF